MRERTWWCNARGLPGDGMEAEKKKQGSHIWGVDVTIWGVDVTHAWSAARPTQVAATGGRVSWRGRVPQKRISVCVVVGARKEPGAPLETS